MLSLPPSVRVFLAMEPTDMRRSFDTLAEMTRQVLKQDPLSGHLFVFHGRRRDRLKILVWDRSGFLLFYKRLEKGTFRFPAGSAAAGVEIDAAELALILEGIDLSDTQRRERFTLRRRT
jgi:transposase